MIIKKSIIVPILILLILFTSTFISLNSIFAMPQEIMGNKEIYVLTSSTDKNPLRSNLDINFAFGLENMSYIQAVSPEIFVFTVLKNEPVTARGVIFSKFLKIENGKLISGTMPRNLDDALVGSGLFKFLNLRIGENITLIGSFQSSIAIVHITGVFKTNDSTNDEIAISIPTAQTLAGLRPGTVSVIRFKTNDIQKAQKLLDPNYPKFSVLLNSTGQIYVGENFNVSVLIENIGKTKGYCNFTLNFENYTFSKRMYITHNASFNITLLPKKYGQQIIKAIVENNILRYTYKYIVSVSEKPVIYHGPILTFVNYPTEYTFKSKNNVRIKNAILKVMGEGISKEYKFNYSINLTFPSPGEYKLYMEKYGYENTTITVKVYKKVSMNTIAYISPQPKDNVIFLKRDSPIYIYTNGNVYYSLDGGNLYPTTGNIHLPPGFMGNHIFSLYITTDNWDMAHESYLIHIYNSSKINFFTPISNNSLIYYNNSFNINVWCDLPLVNTSVYINDNLIEIINQSFSPSIFNYTSTIKVHVNSTNLLVKIKARNIVNTHAYLSLKPMVTYKYDVIKPQIIAKKLYNIWDGESIIIKAIDNVHLSNLSVFIFGEYFNSTENSNKVVIPTMSYENGVPRFIPEGNYSGLIKAIDSSGNINITSFYVNINNSQEKMPPIIIGPNILIFNSEKTEYTYKVYDNSKIHQIICSYENRTIIKQILVNLENYTLYLNSSEIYNGLNLINISAEDIHGNWKNITIKVLRNYTDTQPPQILPIPKTIWSGENLIIKVKDNIKVKYLAIHVFGKWYNSSSTSAVIPTMFKNKTNVSFIPPGLYSINVYVWDIFNNRNYTNQIINVSNKNEGFPPIIFPPQLTHINATDKITITSVDNVKVEKMWIKRGSQIIVENFGNKLNFPAYLLGAGIVKVEVFAEDVNNNIASLTLTFIIKDNIPPTIYQTEIKIWSGNTTYINFSDNVGIKFAKLSLLNKIYISYSNKIEIKTEFNRNNRIYFLPQGIYRGSLAVEDVSGNINITNFTLIINNTGEKIPPVIVGNTHQIISKSESATFYSFDNVGVKDMWWVLKNTTHYSPYKSKVVIGPNSIPLGMNNITIYAEDVNGNIAMLSVMIEEIGFARCNLTASLYKTVITSNDRGVINIEISTGINPGRYYIQIFLDKKLYQNISIYLQPYESRSFSIKLPYLGKGTHIIKVNNITLTLYVKRIPVENLPINFLLKYDQSLKITGGKEVIYKGFQLSEGNFILVIYALITIATILVALGIYSSLLKGINNKTIATLRAIGASNKQILKIASKEIGKYLVPSIVLGLFFGFALTMIIQYFDFLRAFGHRLIISITPPIILGAIAIGFGFLILSTLLIFKGILSSRVTHLMGSKANEKFVSLEEVIK